MNSCGIGIQYHLTNLNLNTNKRKRVRLQNVNFNIFRQESIVYTLFKIYNILLHQFNAKKIDLANVNQSTLICCKITIDCCIYLIYLYLTVTLRGVTIYIVMYYYVGTFTITLVLVQLLWYNYNTIQSFQSFKLKMSFNPS